MRPLLLVLLFVLTAPLAAQPLPDASRADTLDLSVWTRGGQAGVGFGRLPLRSVREVAALTPGMYRDFGDGSLFYRASSGVVSPQFGGVFDRERVGQGPTFVIDGVRVVGEPVVPFEAVEQVEVVEGHVPARYGEAAGGLVLVETRGGGERFGGSVEGLSSAGLDAFGYDLGAFSAHGPLGSARFGRFSFTGEVRRLADATPYGRETYRLSDEAYAALLANPQVVRITDGSEERFVPLPWEAVRAAAAAGEPFTNDDLRGALDLPTGFDLAGGTVVVDAPATFTAERFERTHAKDDPLDGVTLSGQAELDLAPALGLRFGGTLDRERYDRTAAPAERFTNALYNRDALYEAERDRDRFHAALAYRPGRARFELHVDGQRWRTVQHPRGFSADVRDALFYGDVDDERNAVARRYVVLRGGEYEFLYDQDGGSRPGSVGGLFALPGSPATVYRRAEGTALRLHGRAVLAFGVHRVEVGGEVERQTHRRFELAGAGLARYYADGDADAFLDGIPAEGVERYDQLPFEAVESRIITRYGYDYLGTETVDGEDVDGYFGGTNTDVAPYRPTYVAGYVQDRLKLGALTLDLGLRAEALGSDAAVPVDLYALFPIVRAGDLGDVPDGIGADYAVYFNDLGDVVGFRDLGGTFYDAGGDEVRADAVIGTLSGQVEATDAPLSTAFETAATHVVLSPRVGVQFEVSERARLFAYYNRLARRPSPAFFEPFTTYPTLTGHDSRVGNARLEPEVVDDLGLGAEGRPLEHVTLRAGAFYRRHDRITQEVISGGFPSYVTYRNGGTMTVYGLDLAGALAPTHGVALRAGYVLSFANGTGFDAASAGAVVWRGIDVPDLTTPADSDVRHAFDVAAEYRIAEGEGPEVAGIDVLGGFGLGAVFSAQSGRPYTALSTPGFSVSDPFASEVDGGINEARLPWVSQLDLRVEKRFRLGSGALDAFVWVENVLGAENVLAVYRATGEAGDDGFLGTPGGQAYIAHQPSPASGTFNYLAFSGGAVNIGGVQGSGGPLFYGLPRRVRLGLRLTL